VHSLSRDNGAVNVPGAGLGATLQRAGDLLQESIAPVDGDGTGGSQDGIELFVG
jgi:hypothetical protein